MSDATATGTDFDILSLASSVPDGDVSEPVSVKVDPQRSPSLRQRLEHDRLFYQTPLEVGAAVLRLERIWSNLCQLWPQDAAARYIDVHTQQEKLEMLEELLELIVLMRVQSVRTCLHEFYANATTIIKLSRATEGELQSWWNVVLHAAEEPEAAVPLEEHTRRKTREVFGRLWELREAAIRQRNIEGLLTPAELELEGCEESNQIGSAIDVPEYGQIRCRLWMHRRWACDEKALHDIVYEGEREVPEGRGV